MSGETILVVEDEPTIAEVVGRYLEREGYRTLHAASGPEAVAAAAAHRPDLVVLDVMLPGFDGLEVMRRLHERPGERTPVVMLTARAEEHDRIAGLRRGADDYVVKPFSPRELVTRVAAVLRRASPEPSGEEPIRVGEVEIRPAERRVLVRGEDVVLTLREFDLLHHLARHPGQVFSREALMETVWRFAFWTDASTVTVHVRRLRAKLEADPRHPVIVETVWGVGYRLRAS